MIGATGHIRPREPADTLPPQLLLAFAPLHKSAFGVAVALATGLLLCGLTVARLLLDPAGRTDLSLLAQYFYGYEQSWRGALVGLLWGGAVGFVAGWFAAFARNLVVASWIFVTRTRAELAAMRDFLDHV